MIFCSQCGAQLKENSKFCKKCGAPVEDHDVSAATKKFEFDIDIEAEYGIPEIDKPREADFPIKKSALFDTQTQEIVNYVNNMDGYPGGVGGADGDARGVGRSSIGGADGDARGVGRSSIGGVGGVGGAGAAGAGRQGHAFSPGKPMTAYNPQDNGISGQDYSELFSKQRNATQRANQAMPTDAQRQGGYGAPPRQNDYPNKHNPQSDSLFQSRKILLISVAVTLIVLVVVLLAVLLPRWTGGGDSLVPEPDDYGIIEIPRFAGLLLEDIENNDGLLEIFNFVITYEFRAEPRGTIIRQSPSADVRMSAPAQGRRIDIRLTVSQGEEPAMPDLVGLHYIVAHNMLQSLNSEYFLNLQIQTVYQVNEEYIDHVIATIPRSGAQLGRNATVQITIGAEQETPPDPEAEMPDLIGVPYAQARQALQTLNSAHGLELDIRTQERVDEEHVDRVVEIIPRPGATLTRGATVIITVGVEPEIPMVTVPANMVGVTRAALESFFASLGLEPDISLHDSAFPENTVIYVAGVGQEVPVGTAIEVHISSGPAELPVESVTITFAGEVVTDFLGFVGVGTPLAVSIEPTNAAQGAEIIWESDNPNVVEITPDPGGLTATAMHMSPGWTTITVTVNGISGYVIARTQG